MGAAAALFEEPKMKAKALFVTPMTDDRPLTKHLFTREGKEKLKYICFFTCLCLSLQTF